VSGRLERGETYLSDTPVLAAHAGTQPDLFLRWNGVPAEATAVDVAVFLHGFSQSGGAMPLLEKIPRSGLILADRGRPTLAMLPRGNWIRHYYYDFPALLDGGIDVLIAYGLHRLSQLLGFRSLALDRLILAAHSGGGMPAIDVIAGAQAQPDELYVFDGLYGRDPSTDDPMRGLETIERWLGDRFAREPDRPGALRVAFIEGQTGPFSREVAKLVAARVDTAEPARRQDLDRRYRVEAAGVQHSQIARIALPGLLADPAAEIDWYATPRF
jgi:hypothetical protein